MIDRVLALMGKIPTTQGQFCVAAILWLGTGARYIASQEHVLSNGTVTSYWEPSYEWLGALLLLSGVSTAQFLVKRATDTDYVAAKSGTPPQPGVSP